MSSVVRAARDGRCGVNSVVHDFARKLEFSNGANMQEDFHRIKNALRGCEHVEKTRTDVDRTGVDYFAHLKNGVVVKVDAKRREAGASRHWKGEPELAIETWSVYRTKIGWTFNSKSPVEYILYSFEPCDSNNYYFLPFQLLRKAAFDNGREWRDIYRERKQQSGGWESRCIFVPASVVLNAVRGAMTFVAH